MNDLKLYLAFLIVRQFHGEATAIRITSDYMTELRLREKANKSCNDGNHQ